MLQQRCVAYNHHVNCNETTASSELVPGPTTGRPIISSFTASAKCRQYSSSVYIGATPAYTAAARVARVLARMKLTEFSLSYDLGP